jgi:hypothetical protein
MKQSESGPSCSIAMPTPTCLGSMAAKKFTRQQQSDSEKCAIIQIFFMILLFDRKCKTILSASKNQNISANLNLFFFPLKKQKKTCGFDLNWSTPFTIPSK